MGDGMFDIRVCRGEQQARRDRYASWKEGGLKWSKGTPTVPAWLLLRGERLQVSMSSTSFCVQRPQAKGTWLYNRYVLHRHGFKYKRQVNLQHHRPISWILRTSDESLMRFWHYRALTDRSCASR